MNIYWIIYIAVATLLVVLGLVLSLYIFIFFRKLSKGVGRNDLIKILKHISQIEKQNSESIKEIGKTIEDMQSNASYHLQKVALVRFNPFSELGGDHSFVLALLNAHLTGFIITGLHTRERTRVYIKKIEKGKSDQDLSKEEKEALIKASGRA